jgi:hypothetical protein
MKVVSIDNDGVIMYQDHRGLLIRDNTAYYGRMGRSLDGAVDVFCPHCRGFQAHFDSMDEALAAEIDSIYTCQHGHIFCSRCAPDWHESGEPYCAVCQDAAQERFFATLQERGFDAALAEFPHSASLQALYRACREREIDVVYYQDNVYLVRGDGDSLVFDNIPLRDYLSFLASVFWVDDEELQELGIEINTPQDFARVVEYRPYLYWTGGAQFGTFVLPDGRRGWVYETLSGRRLYFIPSSDDNGRLYCTGFDDSTNFRQEVVAFFGVPRRAGLPYIGDIAWVRRPRREENGDLYIPDNQHFWRVSGGN